ncbi:hypothetical protein C7S18_11400 [Ahniella affigens]|uniref:Uncharacterized protein n=1 Tax=Ahniella affigens TaxID=2021234 RepID=A0A2P1PSG0_9GAMM|nr:hypothetical protein [Ahniella affigens]AVP97765.1 hypothetical protein C7S18_11400 [Ahniella affigens]
MGIPLQNRRATLIASALLMTLVASVASAGPSDKIYHPSVERGEKEIEFRGTWLDEGDVYERKFILDLAYTPTDRWKTELVLEYEGDSGAGGELEAFEWENIFVFGEPGQYAVDFGLLAEYEHKFEDGDDEIKIGPLLQKEFSALIATVNLQLQRELGSGHDTELVYGWETRWRGREALEFGLQGFGDLGALDHLGDVDEHRLGPALFGQQKLANGDKLNWNAAVLGSVGSDGPDSQARFQVEYEIY